MKELIFEIRDAEEVAITLEPWAKQFLLKPKHGRS